MGGFFHKKSVNMSPHLDSPSPSKNKIPKHGSNLYKIWGICEVCFENAVCTLKNTRAFGGFACWTPTTGLPLDPLGPVSRPLDPTPLFALCASASESMAHPAIPQANLRPFMMRSTALSWRNFPDLERVSSCGYAVVASKLPRFV